MPAGLIDQWAEPGMGTPQTSSEVEFMWGVIYSWQSIGIHISSATVDARMSPTSTLQRGLAMGQITATGIWKQYDPTSTDGSQVCRGFLFAAVNMLDGTNTAVQKQGRLVWWGNVKASQLGGLDSRARQQVGNRIYFDDEISAGAVSSNALGSNLITAKTADYTVLAADNGTTFTNLGASGAVVFTLPTLAVGLRYRFYVEADNSVTVAAATAGTMVAYNDVAANSIAFSTSSEKVGGMLEVFANAAATKWLTRVNLAFESQTITIAT